MRPVLEPETLERDAAGRPWSSRYDDVYGSRDGPIGQARQVFLAGNGLPGRWAGQRQFVILETGFGLGNNFLASWQAWRQDPQRPQRLHFVSLELHPLRAADMNALAAQGTAEDDAELRALRRQLAAAWPAPLAGIHRLAFDGGRVILSLCLGEATQLAHQLRGGVDAYYLDGFAPERNAALWAPELLKALARLAHPQATVATYTCARAVRDALEALGFAMEQVPGYQRKREMLRGQYTPRWKRRRVDPAPVYAGERHALIVGAGLAGACTAHALLERGWRVTVLEQADGVAAAASALPAGLLHPLLSADDNLAARLSRAGFRYSRQLLAASAALQDPAAPLWAPCGVFQQAPSSAALQALQAQLQRDGWPPDYALARDAGDMPPLLGLQPRRGGVWFAQGGIVSAQRWCRLLLQARANGRDGSGLRVHTGVRVLGAERDPQGWRVRDARGQCYAAPVLILANGAAMASMAGKAGLQPAALEQIGGRLSLLAPPALAQLRAGLCGDGYLVPPLLGGAAAGASYERALLGKGEYGTDGPGKAAAHGEASDDGLGDVGGDAGDYAGDDAGDLVRADLPDAQVHALNLARLERLLVAAPPAQAQAMFAGQRCVARDRLPLAGALADAALLPGNAARLAGAQIDEWPRQAGLYCLAALGSRGLSLAPLLGEALACAITGEPAPLEAALLDAVDPARFPLRAAREAVGRMG